MQEVPRIDARRSVASHEVPEAEAETKAETGKVHRGGLDKAQSRRSFKLEKRARKQSRRESGGNFGSFHSTPDAAAALVENALHCHSEDRFIGEGGFLLPGTFEALQDEAKKVILGNIWRAFLDSLAAELTTGSRLQLAVDRKQQEREKKREGGRIASVSRGPGDQWQSEGKGLVSAGKGEDDSDEGSPMGLSACDEGGSSPGGPMVQYMVQLPRRVSASRSKKTVVVVGNSPCGTAVARALDADSRFDVCFVVG